MRNFRRETYLAALGRFSLGRAGAISQDAFRLFGTHSPRSEIPFRGRCRPCRSRPILSMAVARYADLRACDFEAGKAITDNGLALGRGDLGFAGAAPIPSGGACHSALAPRIAPAFANHRQLGCSFAHHRHAIIMALAGPDRCCKGFYRPARRFACSCVRRMGSRSAPGFHTRRRCSVEMPCRCRPVSAIGCVLDGGPIDPSRCRSSW